MNNFQNFQVLQLLSSPSYFTTLIIIFLFYNSYHHLLTLQLLSSPYFTTLIITFLFYSPYHHLLTLQLLSSPSYFTALIITYLLYSSYYHLLHLFYFILLHLLHLFYFILPSTSILQLLYLSQYFLYISPFYINKPSFRGLTNFYFGTHKFVEGVRSRVELFLGISNLKVYFKLY